MLSKGAKSVNFAEHNEEISVNTQSIIDKQSEFKGYSGGIANQQRGYTRVNNILQRLENLSDLEKDLNDPTVFSDGISEINGTID